MPTGFTWINKRLEPTRDRIAKHAVKELPSWEDSKQMTALIDTIFSHMMCNCPPFLLRQHIMDFILRRPYNEDNTAVFDIIYWDLRPRCYKRQAPIGIGGDKVDYADWGQLLQDVSDIRHIPREWIRSKADCIVDALLKDFSMLPARTLGRPSTRQRASTLGTRRFAWASGTRQGASASAYPIEETHTVTDSDLKELEAHLEETHTVSDSDLKELEAYLSATVSDCGSKKLYLSRRGYKGRPSEASASGTRRGASASGIFPVAEAEEMANTRHSNDADHVTITWTHPFTECDLEASFQQTDHPRTVASTILQISGLASDDFMVLVTMHGEVITRADLQERKLDVTLVAQATGVDVD